MPGGMKSCLHKFTFKLEYTCDSHDYDYCYCGSYNSPSIIIIFTFGCLA